MLLQDGNDAGAHWPTHNFYSVSLRTEKSRYLKLLTGENKNEEECSKNVTMDAPD